MSSQPFTATPQPQLVPGSNLSGWPTDKLVSNAGPGIAYVDDQAGGNGTALSLGSAAIWQAGTPLWAYSPTTAQLQISDNISNLYDAAGLATQIIDQGLAADIATQVAIAGAPPIDKVTRILASETLSQTGASQDFASSVDCSTYSSLRWRLRIVDVAPAPLAQPVATCTLLFYWLDDLGTKLAVDSYDLLGDNNAWTSWEYSAGVVPVRGQRCRVAIITPNQAGATVVCDLQGSTSHVETASYWSYNGYFGRGGSASIEGYGTARYSRIFTPNLASGGSMTEYPPARAGRAKIHFSYNAAVPANGIDILLQDWTGYPIAGQRTYGGGGADLDYAEEFLYPNRPCNVFIRNRGPAALTTGVQFTITYER